MRPRVLNVRLTDDEYTSLVSDSLRDGVSISVLARQRLLGPDACPGSIELAKLIDAAIQYRESR